MAIRVEGIAHGSEAYRQMVALRRRVLREPLGLDFTPEQLAAEVGDTLIAAFEAEEIVGCLVLTANKDGALQMRQVAVAPERQGQGIGRQMVAFTEDWAREHGVATLILHARETAVSFYLRLGYAVEGEPFTEIGLPHRLMRKAL